MKLKKTHITLGTMMMSGCGILTNGKGTRREYGDFNLDELQVYSDRFQDKLFLKLHLLQNFVLCCRQIIKIILLWAHFDSWRQQRRRSIFVDTHSYPCTTVQGKYRHLVMTCWFDSLFEYKIQHIIMSYYLVNGNIPQYFVCILDLATKRKC